MSFYPIRKADMGLILTVITLLGVIWAGYAKPAAWDQAVKEVAEMRPRIKLVEEQLIEYRSSNTVQMTLIIRELDGIHRELKRR